QELVGGQQQQQPAPQAQPTLIGNVNLPAGQYLMTNVQTSQAFYVVVQGGQMYLSSQPAAQGQGLLQGAGQGVIPGVGQGVIPGVGQGLIPGQQPQQQQQGGVGGFVERGLGNFLKNELSPKPGQ